MKFLCSKCGACCRNIGLMGGAKYGLPVKKDGSCGNLINNECSIYEDRPDVCRVDKMTFKDNYHKNITKKEYFIETTKICHQLIDKEGLDSSYKINIKEYN